MAASAQEPFPACDQTIWSLCGEIDPLLVVAELSRRLSTEVEC